MSYRKRIQDYADRLVVPDGHGGYLCAPAQRSAEVLISLKNEISNLSYRSRIISAIRKELLDRNTRDGRYQNQMSALRTFAESQTKDNQGRESRIGLRDWAKFKLFAKMSLQEQMKVQRGTRAATPYKYFSTPEMNTRLLELTLAPECYHAFRMSDEDMRSLDASRSAHHQVTSQNVLVIPAKTMHAILLEVVHPPIAFAATFPADPEAQKLALRGSPYRTKVGLRDHLIIALALATGRRSAEIVLAGKFTPNPKGNPNTLCFSGQLKKRLGDTGRECSIIPLLAPAKIVLPAIQLFRQLCGPINGVTEVNRRFSKAFSRACKKILAERLNTPSIHLHQLREIYAVATYFASKPRVRSAGLVQNALSPHEHIRRVLGHANQGVSQHYSRLQIDGDLPYRIQFP